MSFVHIVRYENDDDPLSRSAAFAEFQRGIGERPARPPVSDEATLISSYRFLGRNPTR